MMPARTRLLAILVAVVVGAGIGYAVTTLIGGPEAPATVREGFSVGQASIGGPFRLIDQNGRERSDAEFRGRLMLVDFGYTHCPDVCPLGLALMADALDRLGPRAEDVQPIFITVDPARDTPDVLKDYVGHFSERMIGLTGTPEQIAEAARAYRVYYKVHGTPENDPDYPVDHSGFIYLMGRDGRFLTHFTHETPPDKVAEAIRRYL
ncbi:MAG TPA: SCO family protein [Alphaproteobacteria bacterium]